MRILLLPFFLLFSVSSYADPDPDRVRSYDRDYFDTMYAVQLICGNKAKSPSDPVIARQGDFFECKMKDQDLKFRWDLHTPNGRYKAPTIVNLTIYSYPSDKDLGGLCLLGMACVSKKYLNLIQELFDEGYIPQTSSKHPALL